MANSKISTKSEVTNWETVATYVSTFPSDDGEGACDVEVQVGSAPLYYVITVGRQEGEAYKTREEAEEAAAELNAETYEECGEEIVGDGAASVVERTVWYIRTQDDAGGSDEAEDDEYVSEELATVFAEEFAAERDGDVTENAEEYLARKARERAGEPSATGEYCVYWETSLDDSGPRERYETAEQAEAAANLANDGLRANNPGGNLLCGFAARQLVDGEWVQIEER